MDSIEKITKRIEGIKQELSRLGPMHPGNVRKQHNICGTPGCRCKDPKNPQKHGPYYNLGYTWRGRQRSRFVRGDQLNAMVRKTKNHKIFRALVEEWVALSVEQENLERQKEKR